MRQYSSRATIPQLKTLDKLPYRSTGVPKVANSQIIHRSFDHLSVNNMDLCAVLSKALFSLPLKCTPKRPGCESVEIERRGGPRRHTQNSYAVYRENIMRRIWNKLRVAIYGYRLLSSAASCICVKLPLNFAVSVVYLL